MIKTHLIKTARYVNSRGGVFHTGIHNHGLKREELIKLKESLWSKSIRRRLSDREVICAVTTQSAVGHIWLGYNTRRQMTCLLWKLLQCSLCRNPFKTGKAKLHPNVPTWSISTALAILARAFFFATWNQWSINFLNQAWLLSNPNSVFWLKKVKNISVDTSINWLIDLLTQKAAWQSEDCF